MIFGLFYWGYFLDFSSEAAKDFEAFLGLLFP